MANINIDPSISLAIKPPPTMTLPELLNFATSAQQLQRARDLIPLELEQQQIQTRMLGRREQEILPEEIKQARTLTGTRESEAQTAATQAATGQFQLNQNQTTGLMRLVGGYRNDPRINSGDKNKTMEALNEIRAKAIALGIPETRVQELMQTGYSIALNKPQNLPQYFDNVIQAELGASGQQALQTPQLVTTGTMPLAEGGVQTQFGIYQPAQGIVPGGAPTYVPPAAAPAAAPAAPPSVIPPAPAAAPVAPRGVTSEDMTRPLREQEQLPEFSRRPPLNYPVRTPGMVMNRLPQEIADETAGTAFKNNLIQSQTTLPTARRNVEEVIKTVQKLQQEAVLPTSGILGAAQRRIATALGDTTYIQLQKDLANVQLSTLKAMGDTSGTVAGINIAQMAAGDQTYPPEVLLSIANRAAADLTNMDMMAKGIQEHSKKFGDNNTNRFRQMWSANADSRLFEIMNIERDISDPTKRKERVEQVLGGMNEAQRRILLEKYRNIQRLTTTGDL